MKITTKYGVFVQTKDIFNLSQIDPTVPKNIFGKIQEPRARVLTPFELEKFVKYKNPDEVRIIENQDWIVDYSFIHTKTFQELNIMLYELEIKKNQLLISLNSLTETDKRINKHIFITMDYNKCIYKQQDILNIIYIKQGLKPLKLPEEFIRMQEFEKQANNTMKIY
jgi:hypothetical protein